MTYAISTQISNGSQKWTSRVFSLRNKLIVIVLKLFLDLFRRGFQGTKPHMSRLFKGTA
jgi:hypothetical protein